MDSEKSTKTSSSSIKEPLMASPISTGFENKKKLKQARLPFAKLEHSSPPVVGPKKRKLSDTPENPKAKKSHVVKKGGLNNKVDVIDISDNEVSSSSEAENLNQENKRHQKVGILDKYLRIDQQLEVSTSSNLEQMDVEEAEDDVLEEKEDPLNSSSPSTSDKENKNSDVVKYKDAGKNDTDEKVLDKSLLSLPDSDIEDEDLSIIEEKNQSKADISCATPNQSIMEDDDSELDTTPASSSKLTPSGKSGPSTAKTPASQKKIEREAERQKKKDEKERERLEKQQKRDAEKQERERKKEELRLKKEEEKQKKEQERLLKKEQQEQERLKREEERKKKQAAVDEEKQKKEDEKRKKEEERKRKEEEKKREEDEKVLKAKKRSEAFKSFFIRSESPITTTTKPVSTGNSIFREFELGENMKLAPTTRYDSSNICDRLDKLDDIIDSGIEKENLYVNEIRSGKTIPGKSLQTWKKPTEEPSNDIIIASENEDSCDVIILQDHLKKNAETMKAKLLQFHTDYRPPYYGTWRKRSKRLSPKNPFKRDEVLFDYEVDSDDEWEEEEPGESLSHSEGEDDEDDDKDKDGEEDGEEGFFVPHGYLSEGEGCEDDEEEITPELLKARQKAKMIAFELEMKKKTTQMIPIIIGLYFSDGTDEIPLRFKKLRSLKAMPLMPTPIATRISQPTIDTNSPSLNDSNNKKGQKKRPVPDEAMPDLLRLVHGNVSGIKKLVREFREYWKRKTTKTAEQSAVKVENEDPLRPTMETNDSSVLSKSPDTSKIDDYEISKRQLEIKIASIANYTTEGSYHRKCWYVNNDELKKHGSENLPIPSSWEYVTGVPAWAVSQQDKEKDTESTTKVASTPKNIPSIKQFTVKSSHEELLQSAAKVSSPQVKQPRRISLTSVTAAKPGTSSSPNSQQTGQKPPEKKRIQLTTLSTKPAEVSVVKPAAGPANTPRRITLTSFFKTSKDETKTQLTAAPQEAVTVSQQPTNSNNGAVCDSNNNPPKPSNTSSVRIIPEVIVIDDDSCQEILPMDLGNDKN